MSVEKRRFKRISVELPVRAFLFNRKKQARLGEPIDGQVKNFSPVGAALRVDTIQCGGVHLFYTCQDDPDIILELIFGLSGDPNITVKVPASPVWYDRDLDSDQKQFVIGLEFLLPPKSREIKSLCREACRDEMRLVSLWKKLF